MFEYDDRQSAYNRAPQDQENEERIRQHTRISRWISPSNTAVQAKNDEDKKQSGTTAMPSDKSIANNAAIPSFGEPQVITAPAVDKTRVQKPVDPQIGAAFMQTPRPNPVPYGPDYYLKRATDYETRTGRAAPAYYRGYGDKYLNRFMKETRPTLSPQGKAWLDRTLNNLQVAIERRLMSGDYFIENDSEKFSDFTFGTHVAAYEAAGVLSLSIMDKVKIVLTPDAVDLFSDRGLAQAAQIGRDQFAAYALHPAFAAQQVQEIANNESEIVARVHEYYLKNKKFFDNAARTNPQQWSDPEHKIIGIIRNVLIPSFNF